MTIASIGFTGHRQYDNEEFVASELAASIERALAAGAKQFAAGAAAGADMLFLNTALDLRDNGDVKWYDVKAVWVCAFIPFPQFREGWSTSETAKRMDMIVKVNEGPYEPWKMHARNHAIVDDSGAMISIYDGRKNGGTYETLKYARRKGVPIFWIDPLNETTKWIRS